MNWKDNTLQTPHLRIQVLNSHIYHKGVWVVSVRELGWDCKEIGIPDESTPEQAHQAAVQLVKSHLSVMITELDQFMPQQRNCQTCEHSDLNHFEQHCLSCGLYPPNNYQPKTT